MKHKIKLIILCLTIFTILFSGCTQKSDTNGNGNSNNNNNNNNNNNSDTTVGTINFFKVTPNKISPGESANLSWNVTGANSISINNKIGSFDPIGNTTIYPTQTTTYTLTADFSVNIIVGSGKKTVTVKVRSGLPIIINLSVAEWDNETNTVIWNVTSVEGGPITTDEIIASLVDENDDLVIGSVTETKNTGLIEPGFNFTVIAPTDGSYIFKIVEETTEGSGEIFFTSELTKY